MDVFINMLYGDEPEYLQSIAEYADEIHAPVMRKQTAQILRFFISDHNIKYVLEIGTAIGYSALCMAEYNKNAYIDTIEKVPARVKDAGNNFEKYDTGKRIYSKMNPNRAILANDLEEAVSIAKEVTEKGKVCLLSPAAASYGYFKNFEERGNKFKELIKK